MATSSLILLGVAALVGLLAMARASDRVRQREIEARMNAVLSPRGRAALRQLTMAVQESALAARVCRKALLERDAAKLRRAMGYVEGFAPGVLEGLAAMRSIARSVSVLVDLPPIRPLAFQAWRLRELASLARLGHVILVAGAERMRLRTWLLGSVFRLCLGWLRRSAQSVPRDADAWMVADRTLADLVTVGNETELTYEHVIRCLDAVGRLVPASTQEAPLS